MTDKKQYTIDLYNLFKENGSIDRAQKSAQYLKNLFTLAGLTASERRALQKDFFASRGFPGKDSYKDIVYLLWNVDMRDCQYCAIDILIKNKKLYTEDIIGLVEYCIVNKSWWDSVDLLAAHAAGEYFKLFPDKITSVTERWMNSGNMWLQRSALLFQLKYKQQPDTLLLENYISQLTDEKDFFIRKAIGWVLREYSKTNAKWVIDFVQRTPMSELSKMEALRKISP